jgi:hypothetical protein
MKKYDGPALDAEELFVSITLVAVIVEERTYKKTRRHANLAGTKFKNM